MSDLHQCELHRIAYWHPSGCPMCKSDTEQMETARALLQARADAAVALAYEAAAEFVGNEATSFPDNVAWCVEDLAKAIRALAPDAGTAELAKLRERAEKAEREVHSLTSMLAIRLDERDTLAASLAAQTALVATLTGALREIAKITERKESKYPADWQEQIAACPECQRYKDHPIQRGICDTHRKPIYAQEDHDRHETRILGYRAQQIARAALDAATLAAMTPEDRALCERSLAVRDAWKKVLP